MFNWGHALREILAHRQGEADLQDIYADLEEHFPLDKDDMRETRFGGREAFQHTTRSAMSTLRKAGDVLWVSRGRYRLTDKGRLAYDAESAASR